MSESAESELRRLRDILRERGEAAMRAATSCPDLFQAAHHLPRNAAGGRRIPRYIAPLRERPAFRPGR